MDCKDLESHFGSPAKAMAAVGGVSRQAWHYWKRAGIPYFRQCDIQLTTGGALKASKIKPRRQPKAAA
jgi:hypothetical protein